MHLHHEHAVGPAAADRSEQGLGVGVEDEADAGHELGRSQHFVHHLLPRGVEADDEQHVLSMARSADPDSASSQFFVCLTRDHCRHLDNQYTGFGKVVEGMDVVEQIAATEVDPQSGQPVGEAPKMISAKVVEADE